MHGVHLHPPGDPALRFALLNDWQRDFPLVAHPFETIGARYGTGGDAVIRALRLLHAEGAVTRVGGVFNVGAGGAGLLCAMQVPESELGHVAARVSREATVNHNYARDHRLNLWFVVTGGSAADANATAEAISVDTGLGVLRLPMRRAFHIDLGFDLRSARPRQGAAAGAPRPVPAPQRALAAQLELGLPLVERPYEALGHACGRREDDVLRVLEGWVADGTLRRLGVIVRHHELGFTHNAMTVFDVSPADLDERGRRLAACPGVTLCYERAPAPDWPFNLYAMVHGRSRAETEATIAAATRAAGLDGVAHEILFSSRRFKQTGSRYFAEALA